MNYKAFAIFCMAVACPYSTVTDSLFISNFLMEFCSNVSNFPKTCFDKGFLSKYLSLIAVYLKCLRPICIISPSSLQGRSSNSVIKWTVWERQGIGSIWETVFLLSSHLGSVWEEISSKEFLRYWQDELFSFAI